MNNISKNSRLAKLDKNNNLILPKKSTVSWTDNVSSKDKRDKELCKLRHRRASAHAHKCKFCRKEVERKNKEKKKLEKTRKMNKKQIKK